MGIITTQDDGEQSRIDVTIAEQKVEVDTCTDRRLFRLNQKFKIEQLWRTAIIRQAYGKID